MPWKKTRHKFGAKPVEVDNIKFSSKLERNYYEKLKILQKSGEVIGFFMQTPLHLPGKIKYVMDFFVFYSDGTCEAIEVKGFETPEWKMKAKLVKEFYPWLPLTIVKK